MQDIILRNAHDNKMNGHKTRVDHDVKTLDIPEFCGCVSSFAPAGWTEVGEDDVVREVWKQVGFRFNEYLPPL